MKQEHALFKILSAVLLAFPAVALSSTVSSWRVSSDIDGFGENNVKVCLYKTGFAQDSTWQAIEPLTAGNDCHELVVFDLASRAIYLSFPGSISNPTYFCSNRVKVSGRHPCNSSFFVSIPGEPDKRALDHTLLKNTLVSSGGMLMADQMIVARLESERNECQKRLDSTRSVQDVQIVMEECEKTLGGPGHSQARSTIERLQKEAKLSAATLYRNSFEFAIRTNETRLLTEFIERYSSDDPDRLVPKAIDALAIKRRQEAIAAEEARRRLAVQAERESAERTAREREQQRRSNLVSLESRISTCKAAIAAAGEVRVREQTISASSGYTNPSTLRGAAATEYDCSKIIAESFRRYQQLGGTKSLTEIQ